MAELKPGDKVGLLAPLGHGFFEEEYLPRAHECDEILHVAGGIGIAALLLPAKQLAEAGFKQRLFFGARTKDDLVGVKEFKPLVRAMLLATENGSAGYRGFVTRPLEEYLTKHTNKKVLAHGVRSGGDAARHGGTGQALSPSLPGFHGESHGLRAGRLPGLLDPRPGDGPRSLPARLHGRAGVLGGENCLGDGEDARDSGLGVGEQKLGWIFGYLRTRGYYALWINQESPQ